jgi:D-3-phosphoglycerate dehydrogenase
MAKSQLSFPKERIKVLLLEGVDPSAVEVLSAAGYSNVEQLPNALSEKELLEVLPSVHMLGIRSRTQLTEPVITASKHLLAIGCFCIGTNQVDLKAAQMTGIPVFNAPFSNSRSVAELAIANIINLMRGLTTKNAAAHEGKWLKSAKNSNEVRGKTLGIIGYGRIGIQVGVLAEALGMKVIFYDAITKLPLGNATQRKNVEDVLAEADVVTLHVPETAETKNMITAKEINLMKPGAKLINSSRGTVIDIPAAAEAIKSGRLGGGAFDVFPKEPASSDEKFISELQGLDNVILTPHIGSGTIEAQHNIGIEVAQKLVTYSDNGSTSMAVNFPEVDLPPQHGRRRLLHVHHNQPGILSALNKFLTDSGANIAAQYLQTGPEIGYVVIDLDKPAGKLDIAALKKVPGTIKTRILY